jgi:HD-GYP domain-containing protein (c-di-GMP phosphodiesterase class II)
MIKTVEIAVDRLSIGMYVAELDRPWLETPFLFQGFRVTEQDEVDTLRRLCKRVRIDLTLGDQPAEPPRAKAPLKAADTGLKPFEGPRKAGLGGVPNVHRVEEEFPRARQTHVDLARTLKDAMDELRSGRVLSIEPIQATSAPLIDSIGRNPDALAWLIAMERKDAGMYRHSMAVAVLVLTFGRHLGLPRAALESMALGGLLFDVGKTRVSDSVLMKPDRLTDEEFERFQQHVGYGVDILTGCHDVNEAVLAMVRTHHERHDGSGYPLGLKGDSIPPFGKIVGIADVYQTMLDSPTAGRRLSPHDVLNYLNAHRGKLFDASLVEEFVEAIGIYPTGTFVKLSDGSVGVVHEQNRLRRLLPRVLVVLDGAGQRLKPFGMIDLLMQQSAENQLQIVECLEPGACGLDPEELFL